MSLGTCHWVNVTGYMSLGTRHSVYVTVYTSLDPCRWVHVTGTAVQAVYNPFSQFVPQLELYSQLQLSLQSDHIALGVPIST